MPLRRAQTGAPVLYVPRSRARAYALQKHSVYVPTTQYSDWVAVLPFETVDSHYICCRRGIQCCVGLQLVSLPPRLALFVHVTPVGVVLF